MKRMWSRKELKEMVELIKKNVNTLVDSDGHDRFIEGDIEFEEIAGITQTYGKWSLSGTHLMIVVAGSIANGTEISAGKLCSINLPQWVLDKIYEIYNTYVEVKNLEQIYGSGLISQTLGFYLRKTTELFIDTGSVTASDDRNFRVQFDLLIDN